MLANHWMNVSLEKDILEHNYPFQIFFGRQIYKCWTTGIYGALSCLYYCISTIISTIHLSTVQLSIGEVIIPKFHLVSPKLKIRELMLKQSIPSRIF